MMSRAIFRGHLYFTYLDILIQWSYVLVRSDCYSWNIQAPNLTKVKTEAMFNFNLILLAGIYIAVQQHSQQWNEPCHGLIVVSDHSYFAFPPLLFMAPWRPVYSTTSVEATLPRMWCKKCWRRKILRMPCKFMGDNSIRDCRQGMW